ncbi:hypothetical protein [Sinorhizobium fredii]|nr:hypothetical protein [Sinorhizobium fredii]
MKVDRRHAFRRITMGMVTVLALALFMGTQATSAQAPSPINANDVSILFPLPNSSDMSGFISLADLTDSNGQRLLSDQAFGKFISAAESDDSKIVDSLGGANQIAFPPEIKDVNTWFVAGIRLDLGAPGLAPDVMAKFGQIPQLRLILQPVTRTSGTAVRVHDRAAHIIFSFASGPSAQQETCPVRVVPRIDADMTAFRPLLDDFVSLRDDLTAGKLGSPVETGGPLNVHPGLSGPDQQHMRDRLEVILEKHLKASQVTALAVMGIPKASPEPWIFLAMRRNPASDTVQTVPSPAFDGQAKAQLLKFVGPEQVLPEPKSDNQSEITTCFRMPNTRVGVSTAELLRQESSKERNIEVTEIIADPARSHFFNTDCVSCHTETRLLLKKVPDTVIPGVDVSVLPRSRWNVRNFGWGFEGGTFKPTITRRTATETDEVVKAANQLLIP